jgi:hypothetical protein
MPTIRWMHTRDEFAEFEHGLESPIDAAKDVAALTVLDGWCPVCSANTRFVVATGARFSERPNLREGLRCSRCKLTARQRLLLLAVRETLGERSQRRGVILERYSRAYRWLKRAHPNAIGSEFLSGHHISGRRYFWWPPGHPWRVMRLRHESITGLSFDSSSLDFVVHTDVLEHVADTGKALEECHRVLSKDGVMIFTAPFFSQLGESMVRGYLDKDGALVELLPAEYHGDGLNSRGVYTFHNFGWSFFDKLRSIFSRAQIGAVHSPESGLVYADSVASTGNMLPIVFRAYK